MSAILPYLVVPLFFAADYMASEETLKAGVDGYKQRAEAARKRCIAGLEAEISKQAKSLAAAKKAKPNPAMIGEEKQARQAADGSWFFATGEAKGAVTRGIERKLEGFRETLAGLKDKSIFPQLTRLPIQSAGGCTSFAGIIVPAETLPDGRIKAAVFFGFPFDPDDGMVCIVESFEVESARIGEPINARGVYQYVGNEDAKTKIFRWVKEVPTGGSKCPFDAVHGIQRFWDH